MRHPPRARIVLQLALLVICACSSLACSRKRETIGARRDIPALEVKTDLAILRKYSRVPPIGVESARWVAVPDPGQSWLPPTLYRFYIYYQIDPASWPDVEKVTGLSEAQERLSLPVDAAKAILGPLADDLVIDGESVEVDGLGHGTAWLGHAQSAAVRFRGGLLVTSLLYLD